MKRILLGMLAALAIASSAHAQTINNLTAGGAVSGTDLFPAYQGANPAKKVSASQLSTYILGIIGGDCSVTAGSITCTKTGGVSFGYFATGTDAANLTGTLAAARLPATPLATGTTVSLTAPRQYYVCTGACTVTPPVPAAGYEFCVMNGNNVATVITLAALGSSARYENAARSAYGTAGTGTMVSGGAVGDKICIVGLDSTHYLTPSYNGTWTAN